MKRQGRLTLFLWLAWLAPSLFAQTSLPVHVLAEDGPFRDSFVQALDDAAMPPITRVADPEQAELLIAIGDQAFRRAQKLDKPLLGVYVSRAAVTLAQRKRCQCQGIWAGVALNDQLAMLEIMMPLARRVGVIVGPQSAWTAGMIQDYQGRLGLTLLPVSSVEELGDRLRERLAEFDALVLPVDGQLFGPGTAKLVPGVRPGPGLCAGGQRGQPVRQRCGPGGRDPGASAILSQQQATAALRVCAYPDRGGQRTRGQQLRHGVSRYRIPQ